MKFFLTKGTTRLGSPNLPALLAVLVAWGSFLRVRAGEDGPDWVPETRFAPVLIGDLKQGFVLRADTWDGNLPAGETKPIRHQFIKGNDYHFYVSTSVPGAVVSLHIYDQDGNLAESGSWKKEAGSTSFAGANFRPASTANYYLIVKADRAPTGPAAWAMAYAYK